MVNAELKRFLALPSEKLTDDDKEEFYKIIIHYKPDDNVETDDLRNVFHITQEVLKLKGEQVDSLIAELDEIAALQGEQEANHQQEIEELRLQLSRARHHSGGTSLDDHRIEEEFNVELEQAELRIQHLMSELQSRDQELESNKRELERFAGVVANLERERDDLKRELTAVREETRDQRDFPPRDSPPSQELREKTRNLMDTLRNKNKHISQLLNDIEIVEKENVVLREKMLVMKTELADATEHITQINGQLSNLQISIKESQDRNDFLESQSQALRNQVEELVEQQRQRDEQIDDFSEALDVRVQELKRVIEEKNAEIQDLREQLSFHTSYLPKAASESENNRVAMLSQMLQSRDQQIEDLQNQVSQLKQDLQESVTAIDTLRAKAEKAMGPIDANGLEKKLRQAEQRIQMLEEKVTDAEQDAQVKAQELTELVVQLRRYESGEFGLAEAVAEIKQLRQQRRIRDRHIEELVQVNNQLEAACGTLEEQNIALRDRLGLPVDEAVDTEGITAKRRKDQMLLRVQQQRADRLEEDLIELKMEKRSAAQRIRVLTKQLRSMGVEPEEQERMVEDDHVDSGTVEPQIVIEPTTSELQVKEILISGPDVSKLRQLWEAERQATIEENEALRQGLHEILGSVRRQDARSDVQIQSDVLERLLEALDSRHVSGWYHPAMRLQAQLHHVEGRCAVLREELRATRQSKAEASEALHECRLQLAVLKRELSIMRDSGMPVRDLYLEKDKDVVREEEPISPQKPTSPASPVSKDVRLIVADLQPLVLSYTEDMSPEVKEMVSKLNAHLLVVINEYNLEHSRVTTLRSLYNEICSQFVTQSKELDDLKNARESEVASLREKCNELQENILTLETRLAALNESIVEIEKDGGENTKSAIDNARKLADLSAERDLHRFRFQNSSRQLNELRKQLVELRHQLSSARMEAAQRIGDLLRAKTALIYRVSEIEQELVNSVSLDQFHQVQKQLNETIVKCRNLLQHQCPETKDAKEAENRLYAELELEKSLREELGRQLRDAKEKLGIAQMQQQLEKTQQDPSQIDGFTRKIAAAEARVESEKNRASHAESIAALAKEELSHMHVRCAQLEKDLETVLTQNQELQLQEASLRDAISLLPPLLEVKDLKKKLTASQAQVADLQLCRRQLQELVELSHQQVKELEQFREGSELELDTMRATLLQLQTSSDQATVIENLMEASSRTRQEGLSAEQSLANLQMEVGRLQALQLRQEAAMEELREEQSKELQQMTQRARSLQKRISELHVRYMGATPLSALELLHAALERRSTEQKRLKEELKRTSQQLQAITVEQEQESIRREMSLELQNALQAIQGENDYRQTLDSWASRNIELRLQEARSRRQCDILEGRAVQAERRLEEQQELVAQLEEKLVRVEMRHISQMSLQSFKSVDGGDSFEKKTPEKSVQEEKEQRGHEKTEDESMRQDLEPWSKVKILEETIESLTGKIRKQEADMASIEDDMRNLTTRLADKERSIMVCESTIAELRKYELSARNLELKCDQLKNQLQEVTSQQQGSGDSIVAELRTKCDFLQQNLEERERTITELRNESSKLLQLQSDVQRGKSSTSVDLGDTPNTAALKATVDSLQNIINQKEETIRRYQSLLRDAREEESRSVAALQEQVCTLQSDLAVQEQAYNRLKNTVRQQAVTAGGVTSIRMLLETQTTRVHELEDEVATSRTTIASLNSQLQAARGEAARWNNTAQQRLAAMEELSKRLAKQHRVEMEQCQAQQAALLSTSSVSSLLTNKMKATVMEPGDPQSVRSLTEESNRSRMLRQLRGEVEALKHSLHLAEEREATAKKEVLRLRDQLPIYSRRTQNKTLSTREESLARKVSELENQLEEQRLSYEKAEEDFKDKELQKIKSAEQIARWDERKKFEAKVEKLKAQIQEKSAEISTLQGKLDKARESLQRAEKEKVSLQQQIKSPKGPEVAHILMEELQRDRERLRAEVADLRNRCVTEEIHEELAQKERQILDLKNELERIRLKNEELLKANLAFECDNLELRMELERFHADQPVLQRRLLTLEKCAETLQQRVPRKHVVTSWGEPGAMGDPLEEHVEVQNLRRVICELREENQRLLAGDSEHIGNLHGEVCRLRNEKIAVQQRCEDLAAELESARCHIKNIECGIRETSAANDGESTALRAELDHKTQLLNRVKVLLERAAEKERNLRDQVSRLQRLVPPETDPL